MKIRKEIMLFLLKKILLLENMIVRSIWLFKKYDHWKEKKNQ